MKKLVSLLLALSMCVFLVACGGPDKQPAIDAHNKAVVAVNALGDIINQNPEAYADYIDDMNELVDTLNLVADALENRDDLDQEALDEWVEMCEEVEQWAVDAKAELEN